MLTLQLEDGSPYVFPSKLEMDAQIQDMANNTKAADVGSVIADLQKIASVEGPAEILRLKWLKKVIELRLKAVKVSSSALSGVSTRLSSTLAAETPINDFVSAKINSSATPHIELSALGFQAFSTSRINSNSARASYDWASYLNSRTQFWNREMVLANSWIDARLKFLYSNLGLFS